MHSGIFQPIQFLINVFLSYGDGEIVREGFLGEGGATGRGGAANHSPLVGAKHENKEIVPDEATRLSLDTDHHVGRGGAGNEAVGPQEEGKTHFVGLADKLKYKLFKSKKGVAA